MARHRQNPATVLTCPVCGSNRLAAPYDNGHISDATQCLDCDTRMTAQAATPGSDAHMFIWNTQSEAIRRAGFTGVSVHDHGKYCAGGREPIPAGSVAWEDSDGWLWCRIHADAITRGILRRLSSRPGRRKAGYDTFGAYRRADMHVTDFSKENQP